MSAPPDEDKITFMTCVEIVLMKRGNSEYNLIQARLGALYNCEVNECVDHPEYLRTVLNVVYGDDYDSILDEISL